MTTPPPPNQPTYGISALYLYPVFQSSPTFDPSKPFKSWQMPADPTADPDEFVILRYYTPTGVYKSFAITYGEAMAPPNIEPGGLTGDQQVQYQAGPYGQQARPIPARAIIAGVEEIQVIAGIGVQVINSGYVAPPQPQTPQQTTDSQNIAECLRILKGMAGV